MLTNFLGIIDKLLLYCIKCGENLLLLSILDHTGQMRKPRLFA